MHKIIIASTNQGKIQEFKEMLSGIEFDAINGSFEVEENADSFIGNAKLKALAGAQITNNLCLADDSGIEINHLNGAPGIFSGRFLKNPEGGINKILERMHNALDRSCRFVCSLVLVSKNGEILFETEQYWEGQISHAAKGSNGFGYDPIVIPEGETKTVAELGEQYKNQFSHRAKAIQELKNFLSSNEAERINSH